MKISKNKKMRFFLMSQGSFNPKIRFLGLKVCPVARPQTHRHTDTQTHTQTHTKVITEGTLSGFQDFFLQPIIKDRPNTCMFSKFSFLDQNVNCNLVKDRHTHRSTKSETEDTSFRISGASSINV